MFLFFVNLYLAMFGGTWNNFTWQQIVTIVKPNLNLVGNFITCLFGDNTMTNLGDLLGQSAYVEDSFISLVAVILALITSIGIVITAVKGIKKLFTVFFYGVR